MELAVGRPRVHDRPRPQRLRRRAGRAAAGLALPDRRGRPCRPAPVVRGLPAGRLRPDQPDGHAGAVPQHGRDLPRLGCRRARRRRHQPHDRAGHPLLRREDLHQARLRGPPQHGGLPPLPGRLPRARRHDPRLQQLHRGHPLRARRAERPADRDDQGAGHHRRVPEQASVVRRVRVPGRRRQAHRPGRPRGDRVPAAPHGRRHAPLRWRSARAAPAGPSPAREPSSASTPRVSSATRSRATRPSTSATSARCRGSARAPVCYRARSR